MSNSTNALLQHYVKLTEFLGHALGPDYEVALHELTEDSNQIIAISNGELTGRHLGSPPVSYTHLTLPTTFPV